ncbi:hypothetical protein [Sorangium cellulosum]|uniref:hypothetical protein n=1 Tax=Sorangium cellulosum TaxID=56 RepID=UPI00042437AC|nr:hypothetical protein [Sorangium cellulosum]
MSGTMPLVHDPKTGLLAAGKGKWKGKGKTWKGKGFHFKLHCRCRTSHGIVEPPPDQRGCFTYPRIRHTSEPGPQ